ncbi:hypothetical protein [Macrococcoides bohemicum]|uniref:hypothetical protein n=1 Tax=Macrococcoides bohemicum TaxID=1903056 RepID=UPI00165EAF8C|nr:hypothetical protein [Macrococcus bohemicus]MBC9873703.1 hypothetical protein [Macrococcus bohemicus]
MEQQTQTQQPLQRNLKKEIGLYQYEYMLLKGENISLKAQIDDLLEQLNKKDETVSQ